MPTSGPIVSITSHRPFRYAATGFFALAAVWMVLVLWHVLAARGSLSDATRTVDNLQTALEQGQVDQASRDLANLTSNLKAAQEHLDGLSVTMASMVPILGRNVTAVRTVTDSLSDVATDGLPPVVDVASSLDPSTFNPTDGRLDVKAIESLSKPLATLNTSLARADDNVAEISTRGLIGPVKSKVVEAKDKVRKAAQLARRGSIAARVLPEMLGANGPRQYLLIFQNNAEIRATGGLPGAFAIIKASDGKIDLGLQGSGGADLGNLPAPVSPVSPVEQTLFKGGVTTAFSDAMARDLRYTNYTPDFPRTGELAAAILKKKANITVDGVITIDPVTLGYILRSAGGVKLEDGTELTADNAVSILLNKAYIDIPIPQQDAFFASAANKIFTRITSGAGDPGATLRSLTRAASESRLLVWSNKPEIEKVLDPTPLGGVLSQPAAGDPRLGVYFNDSSSGKLEYYLRYRVNAKSTTCTDTGRQTYQETVDLTSQVPASFMSLPDYIIGIGDHTARGNMLLLTYLYAPTGGKITSVKVDGVDADWTAAVHDGRPVAKLTVTLKPGQSSRITSTIESGEGQSGRTRMDVTPSIETINSSSVVPSSCS